MLKEKAPDPIPWPPDLRRVPARSRFRARTAVRHAIASLALIARAITPASAIENVYLTEVPDYDWHGGCFGTATGNLIGFWDRHGFPNFYTGPTQAGVAPLDSFGDNYGILALWASAAGLDGRPFNQPGHTDDYYVDYQFTGSDPFRAAGRPEHLPDCIGDFIGLSQRKWPDLAGECSGNIDGYAFNYFEPTGRRREDFTPSDSTGQPVADIQSGLRAFSQHRGYGAQTFSQLSDFNPNKPPGRGFTFAELKSEIDAGYPVLLFMQAFGSFSRDLAGQTRVNPVIHAMLAYGYVIDDDGNGFVRYRTSWASGDNQFSPWTSANWTPEQSLNLPLRGVIGFHPRPKLIGIHRSGSGLQLHWHGPQSILRDEGTDTERPVHQFIVEQSASLTHPIWNPVAGPVSGLSVTLPDGRDATSFFRIRVVTP